MAVHCMIFLNLCGLLPGHIMQDFLEDMWLVLWLCTACICWDCGLSSGCILHVFVVLWPVVGCIACLPGSVWTVVCPYIEYFSFCYVAHAEAIYCAFGEAV